MAKRLRQAGQLLPALLSQYQLAPKMRQYQALVKWGEAVGHTVAGHTAPLEVKRGVLHVRVDHPVWSHQLTLLKASLVEKINQSIGASVISDITFTL